MSLINQCKSFKTIRRPPSPITKYNLTVSHPKIDGREGSNSDLPRFKHETRPDNSTDFQRDPNTRINFPKSSDVKTWKELDQILSDVLPKIFTARKIRSTTSNELVEEFDDWLHAFFLQHCGPVEAEAVAIPPPLQSPPSVIVALRDFDAKRMSAKRPSRRSRRPACANLELVKL